MTTMTRSALLAAAISTAIGAGAWADTASQGADQNIKIPKPGAPAPAAAPSAGAADFREWELLIASCIDAHQNSLFDLLPMIEPSWDRGDKPVRKLSRRIEGEIYAIHLKFQAERSAPNRDQRAQARQGLASECADSLAQVRRDVAAQVAQSGGKRVNSFKRPTNFPSYSERMDRHGQNH